MKGERLSKKFELVHGKIAKHRKVFFETLKAAHGRIADRTAEVRTSLEPVKPSL